MKTIFVFSAIAGSSVLLSQESAEMSKPDISQLQSQLKAANARISDLEDRITLMAKQQQGVIQFLQAGQALCELDKKQSAPQIQH